MNRFVVLMIVTAHCASAAAASTAAAALADVPADAAAAVAVVGRFSDSLAAGDLKRAGAELTADVIILESGGAERSAAEYLGGHAKQDAEFLKGAHRQLVRRTARRSGDLVWVASETDIHTQKDGKSLVIASAESMVLRSTAAGWKIIHIHWSSHTKKP